MFPKKNQLLKNFLSCINWEERYIYIMDLSKLLPKFPENLRIKKYLIANCQNRTWIALTQDLLSCKSTHNNSNNKNKIKLYGDSEALIIKGIIVIIFIIYQDLDIELIPKFDAKSFLEKLQLNKNLTVSRSQGIDSILNSIKKQAHKIINIHQ